MRIIFIILFSIQFYAPGQNNEESSIPYGRDAEIESIVKALLRQERGNVLLTYKNGTKLEPILNSIKAEVSKTTDRLDLGKVTFYEYEGYSLETFLNLAKSNLKPMKMTWGKKSKPEHKVFIIKNAHSIEKFKMGIEHLKSVLEKDRSIDSGMVKFVLMTTHENSRKLLIDDEVESLLNQVPLRELTKSEVSQAMKLDAIPSLKSRYSQLENITNEALDYAVNFSYLENAKSNRLSATRQMIEGAIVNKMKQGLDKASFIVNEGDIRNYIANLTKSDLLPGSSNFNENFKRKWKLFEKKYGGDSGFKYEIKKTLYQFFSNMDQQMLESWILHGGPGGGKSYFAQVLAEIFFEGKILVINGGELKKEGSLNKLIGSTVGYVGSKEQHSRLTKFLKNNPNDGIIIIEEADYMHHEVIQFLTNTKSDKKFNDGLSKEYQFRRHILIQTTNIGQDAIIPVNAQNSMNWEQYGMRVSQMTKKVITETGEEVFVVKDQIKKEMLRDYIEKIVVSSSPNGDTSEVSQEANKQIRREKNFFVMSPNKKDLVQVARIKFSELANQFLQRRKITLKISDEDLKSIIDIENHDFFKGYSYAQERIKDHIVSNLAKLDLHEGQEIQIKSTARKIEFYNIAEIPTLLKSFVYKLKAHEEKNPWNSSSTMRQKIADLDINMPKYLKGSQHIIEKTQAVLTRSLIDYKTKKVFSLCGTTGNGKTQYAIALAKSLFGSKDASFTITALNKPEDLNNYLRPAAGYQGAKDETKFEQWFKSRMKAGGGVILFDELLSYYGLDSHQLSNKVAVLNDLYQLLDNGELKIGGKVYDASSFVIILTGNSFQEYFENLPPGIDGERQIDKITARIGKDEQTKYFMKFGIDAPKRARMGTMFVKGPLKQKYAKHIVVSQTRGRLTNLVKEAGYNIDFNISDKLVKVIAEKVSTSKLGFRNIEDAMSAIIIEPLTNILAYVPDVEMIDIDVEGMDIKWKVNNQEMIYAQTQVLVDDSYVDRKKWAYKEQTKPNALNKTPSLKDILPIIRANHGYNIELVSVHELEGHWLVGSLLYGRNNAEYVTIDPYNEAAGYVRPKEVQGKPMNITEAFRDMVMLEAGHRAAIYRGLHAFGGGSGKRKPDQQYGDDLYKIQQIIEQIINNKIFPGYFETSSEQQKALFRNTVLEINLHMADYIIDKGIKLGITDELMAKLKKDSYLVEEFLDEYAKSVFKKHRLDRYQIFEEALDSAIAKVSQDMNQTENIDSPKKILLDKIRKTLKEDLKTEEKLCSKHFL